MRGRTLGGVGQRGFAHPRSVFPRLDAGTEAFAVAGAVTAHDAPELGPVDRPVVVVLALFEGQVELLRRLVEQSEILRARTFKLEVALPSRLCQRECDVVFLRLTRSHAHRSVAFGDSAHELPLAFTRSRSRLLVFGDPGSLSKRTHWHGPLDQLDAHAAHQERVRLSRFLAYLQKHGLAPTLHNGTTNGKD